MCPLVATDQGNMKTETELEFELINTDEIKLTERIQ